jgi:hypothetical protein
MNDRKIDMNDQNKDSIENHNHDRSKMKHHDHGTMTDMTNEKEHHIIDHDFMDNSKMDHTMMEHAHETTQNQQIIVKWITVL